MLQYFLSVSHPDKLLRYLDPGSGSMLLQMLLALFLGIGFAVKVYWKKIKLLFTRPPKKHEGDTTDQTSNK